jgi:hypothetical protein
MAFRINPAFRRFPEEAAIVGRILTSFGEIEVSVCRNAAHATRLDHIVMKALYGIRVTSTRIETADPLMRATFVAHDLEADYSTMIGMIWHCLKIRNHKHRGGFSNACSGLFPRFG